MNLRAFALCLATFLLSCEGDAGDVCQIDDDCGSGLECCKITAALDDRGTCRTSCEPVTPEDDASVDGSSSDATDDAE